MLGMCSPDVCGSEPLPFHKTDLDPAAVWRAVEHALWLRWEGRGEWVVSYTTWGGSNRFSWCITNSQEDRDCRVKNLWNSNHSRFSLNMIFSSPVNICINLPCSVRPAPLCSFISVIGMDACIFLSPCKIIFLHRLFRLPPMPFSASPISDARGLCSPFSSPCLASSRDLGCCVLLKVYQFVSLRNDWCYIFHAGH